MSEVIHASQGYVEKTVRTIAAEEVAKIAANAPQDLDTLKEIAEYIESDKTNAAQMVTKIDNNAKAISEEVERAQDAEEQLANKVKELDTAKADKTSLKAEEERAKGAEESLGKEISKKVDKVEGKGLSTNDYTTEDKEKLGQAYSPDNPPPMPDMEEYALKEEVVRTNLDNDISINSHLRDLITTIHFFMNEGYIPYFKMQAIKVDKSHIETYSDSELKLFLN